MKNLLLILLLANILYFVWGFVSGDERQAGIVVVDEDELGPPLDVSTEHDENLINSVGAVLGSGEPSALSAVVGRSCVTVGPFRDINEADTAITQYAGEGMRTARRSEIGDIFVGHWVMIREVPDRPAGNQMLATLRDGGLTDAYMVSTEDNGLDISLGLFGDLERAERVELQAKSLELPASITPRTREGTLYFVDIALPPGKGAGQIVEKYGEDRVALRDEATCPE